MNVVLISTYELGRQPFGLASPAAWFRDKGISVTCLDLSIQTLSKTVIAFADLVAFYIPMHTATLIAINVVKQVKNINPNAHVCFYGLYASMNESLLRKLGANTILGGEFEENLISLVQKLSTNKNLEQNSVISLAKQKFLVPYREELPDLDKYAHLNLGNREKCVVGYTEATRGCKHLCRHCPIVPVYEGKFRIVQREIILEDIKKQVEKGAQHITFGDPDFFNGPGHALAIVNSLHQQFPQVTYDVTIKIEHLLKHSRYLDTLRDTGCLFVTSAVESADNQILEIFDKGHTREDFIKVVSLFQKTDLTLNPTFVTFTPWTSLKIYKDLLDLILELDLVNNISPIQYAIRLLIPRGSKLFVQSFVQKFVKEFDEEALCYPWSHPDSRVDKLYTDVLNIVKESQAKEDSRFAIFNKVCKLVYELSGLDYQPLMLECASSATIPHLSEPWYC